MADLRQSPEYAKYLKLSGWIVEECKGRRPACRRGRAKCKVFIKKFPFFSFIKIQRPQQIPFSEIDKIAKKYRAFSVCLEPLNINHQSSIINHKYHPTKSPYLPSKTIHLNLTLTEKQILARMKKDARYSIRKAKKKRVQIIKPGNIGQYHHAWRKSVSWRRYVPSLKTLKNLKKAFGKKAIFLAAIDNNKFLAGTIILTTNDSAYYYYAFTSKEGRKKFAQYLLVWEAIKLAKKQGCKIFDFEGIYDERFPQKSWKGFSHFKKSFGGKEVKYPGCFRKYLNPFLVFA